MIDECSRMKMCGDGEWEGEGGPLLSLNYVQQF